MIIKKFEDGSEMSASQLGMAMVVGLVIAVPLIMLNEKYQTWRTKRIMKKNNWPE
jgi:hypothetical protein